MENPTVPWVLSPNMQYPDSKRFEAFAVVAGNRNRSFKRSILQHHGLSSAVTYYHAFWFHLESQEFFMIFSDAWCPIRSQLYILLSHNRSILIYVYRVLYEAKKMIATANEIYKAFFTVKVLSNVK